MRDHIFSRASSLPKQDRVSCTSDILRDDTQARARVGKTADRIASCLVQKGGCVLSGTREEGQVEAGGSILLFPAPNEDLAPAVSHDKTDAEEVVGGLESSGRDIPLCHKCQLHTALEVRS